MVFNSEIVTVRELFSNCGSHESSFGDYKRSYKQSGPTYSI